MRTRDVFSVADTYELRKLFLHLLDAKRYDSAPSWWILETRRWCDGQPDYIGRDSRPHLVATIDRILGLHWDERRLRRLLDLHVIRHSDLPPAGITTQELLEVLRDLVSGDLSRRPVTRRPHGSEE